MRSETALEGGAYEALEAGVGGACRGSVRDARPDAAGGGHYADAEGRQGGGRGRCGEVHLLPRRGIAQEGRVDAQRTGQMAGCGEGQAEGRRGRRRLAEGLQGAPEVEAALRPG